MKITMETTDQIVTIDGALARVWKGRTESGIPVFVMVTAVAVHRNEDQAEFERELLDRPTLPIEPGTGAVVDLRNIL